MEHNISRELYFHDALKSIERPRELLKLFSQLFFKTSRFPGNEQLAIVPMGVMPTFVKTNEIICPFDLYEGLVSIQFLTAFNIFIGGNKTISKNAMNEFFHNLSMQALSRDDDRIYIKFDAIEDCIKA